MSQENTPNTSPESTEVVETKVETPVEASSEVKPTDKVIETKEEKELKKAIRKLQLKVDGKAFEEDLPFDLPDDDKAKEYMVKQLQLAKMGHSRANQLSQLDKEIKSFIQELKTNPEKILSDPAIGLDLKQFATKIIEKEIENAKKSPEQLEKEKLENELRKIKEEREKEKEDLQAQQLKLYEQQEYDRYDKEITEALESSDLPKSPYVVKKMAEYMLLALESDKEMNPKDILPLVREEITKDIKDMFGVMPEEVIEQIIGKDTISKLRKRNVARAKEVPPTPVTKALPDIGKTPDVKKAEKKQTYREFFNKR